VTIEAYIAALEHRLPRYRRRRFIAEAEAHLRDSAARHRAAGLPEPAAETAAVADFGDVGTVARRVTAEAAIPETRLAAGLALLAVAFFVFPLYVVPENTLAPATWTEKPRDIGVLQVITVVLWAFAGTLAAASVLLSWTRQAHLAAPVLEVALVTLACSIAVSAVLVVRWFTAQPATLNWPLIAAPLALTCLAVCAAATGWAHSRRCRLARD
jgi:HAAS